MKAMLSFLKQPKNLIATVLVFVSVAVMLRLGAWQLQRVDERRKANQVRLTARNQTPLQLPSRFPASIAQELPAVARGVFEKPSYVILNRGYKGEAGVEIVTPLRLMNGSTVLVNRGWIPLSMRDRAPEPVSGPVTVSGFLYVPEFGDTRVAHPPTLPPNWWVRVDPKAMAAAEGRTDILPFALQATVSTSAGRLPVPQKLQPLDDGPHMNYAIQWFAFAAIFFFGWMAWLRKQWQMSDGK